MKIRELFEWATKEEETDLIALIMFLVYEKKVLSLNDDVKELDLYFLPKHKERMNRELSLYKEKMGIKYGLNHYKIVEENKTFYVRAESELQAVMKLNIKEFTIMALDPNTPFIWRRRVCPIKELPDKNGIIGGHDNEEVC